MVAVRFFGWYLSQKRADHPKSRINFALIGEHSILEAGFQCVRCKLSHIATYRGHLISRGKTDSNENLYLGRELICCHSSCFSFWYEFLRVIFALFGVV